MPDYVNKTLSRLQHTPKFSPQNSLQAHIPIQYTTKNTRQYATAPDTSLLLLSQEKTYIQSITVSHLYYGHAIDHTIIPVLDKLSSEQAQPTQNTKAKAQRVMYYVHTFLKKYITYYAIDMILHIDSNAVCFVAPKARNKVTGYFHLSDHPNITEPPKLNRVISV